MLLFQKLMTKKLFCDWVIIVKKKKKKSIEDQKNHENILKLSPV